MPWAEDINGCRSVQGQINWIEEDGTESSQEQRRAADALCLRWLYEDIWLAGKHKGEMECRQIAWRMESRFQSLEIELSDPAVIADQTKWRALSKEHADMAETVMTYRRYKDTVKAAEEDRSILGDHTQEELHELAKEDLKERESEAEELERKLHILLLPKDPNDEKNVILEIRAGTGGEEAALFAGDLLRMYLKFAERKGWTAEITDSSPTELGGFKEVTCMIQGKMPIPF